MKYAQQNSRKSFLHIQKCNWMSLEKLTANLTEDDEQVDQCGDADLCESQNHALTISRAHGSVRSRGFRIVVVAPFFLVHFLLMHLQS